MPPDGAPDLNNLQAAAPGLKRLPLLPINRFLGANPFGFAALDIKAFYMGATGCTWSETRSSEMATELRPLSRGDHDALHDAKFQAELFRLARAWKR